MSHLIVVRVNLFHRLVGFMDVLRTFKLQYPDWTFRQVNNYKGHIDDREDDEREVYDFPF